ncbi:peroxisomal targeting signal 1 receptor [Chelonus insularis]|uniref:peroxisomal targeting signal 1 receptor n=1 Tax=Chelonus insularis TaxID=460826 RepID=UPI00158BB841|nr:peroxisomal targeting signal 1 receptor [Chelonus insularis]
MALRELVEGDCGGPSPFTTFTSHLVQDRGFREEGLGQSQLIPFQDATSDQLVDEFLDSRANPVPQTFKMKDIFQEINEIDQSLHPPISPYHPVPMPTESRALSQDSEWTNQFLENKPDFYEQNTDRIWSENHLPPRPISQENSNEFGLGQTWAEDYIEQTLETGTDEIRALDSFSNPKQDDPRAAYSKFMKFMNQENEQLGEGLQHPVSLNINSKWAQEFSDQKNVEDQSSDDVKNDDVLNKNEDDLLSAGWLNEFFDNPSGSEAHESAFWSRLQDEWDKISNKQVVDSHPWISEYESYYDPFKDYKFSEDNPMKDSVDALEQGRRRLEAGDLPSAVLCFEAAVQQDAENSEAWLLLGKTQAENEQDPAAIAALKKCLTLDPSNSTALMTLAVAYTNESYQNQACLTLKEWLMKNEKYNHLLVNNAGGETTTLKSSVSTILFNSVHNEVKDLFIQAARMNPTNEIDTDVQIGLGVLFNLSSEYDKAADCFRAALQVCPDDSRLWNRLGASLANGQRSEEAVDAYSRALELSPGFIRARYNLGISCINLGAYKEAAEHLLTALNQQAAGKGIDGQSPPPRAMSECIWSTLRLVISLMHKYQLSEAVEVRDLAKLNREFEMV